MTLTVITINQLSIYKLKYNNNSFDPQVKYAYHVIYNDINFSIINYLVQVTAKKKSQDLEE